jgi:hypothetical protein
MEDISQFPKVIDGTNFFNKYNAEPKAAIPVPKPIKPEKKKPVIIEAMPGEPLPENCPDYRPFLQRDGLILHSWEIYGGNVKIVWLSANRGMMKYQAWIDDESDLPSVCPEHKYHEKYDYYSLSGGEPDFIIYAAPPGLTASTRSAFVAKLKDSGVSVNFDYEFTLGKQKAAMEAAVFDRIENSQNFFSSSGEGIMGYFQSLLDGCINELCEDGTIDRWKAEKLIKV